MKLHFNRNCLCIHVRFHDLQFSYQAPKILPWKFTWISQVQFFTDTHAESSFLKTFTVDPYFNGAYQFKVGFFLGHGQESSSGF